MQVKRERQLHIYNARITSYGLRMVESTIMGAGPERDFPCDEKSDAWAAGGR